MNDMHGVWSTRHKGFSKSTLPLTIEFKFNLTLETLIVLGNYPNCSALFVQITFPPMKTKETLELPRLLLCSCRSWHFSVLLFSVPRHLISLIFASFANLLFGRISKAYHFFLMKSATMVEPPPPISPDLIISLCCDKY